MNDKVRGGVGSGAHTPGAIRMRDVGDAHCLYFGNHGRPFATMYHANMPREEASRLMATLAAAPDLIAALKDAARWINLLPAEIRDGSIMPEKLAEVIAKAEGRS